MINYYYDCPFGLSLLSVVLLLLLLMMINLSLLLSLSVVMIIFCYYHVVDVEVHFLIYDEVYVLF